MHLPFLAVATIALSAQAPERRVYTVATAHLDTQWLWTIQTTIREYIPDTLRVNLAYFDKYPDYVFNFEGAYRYMLAKEYYPDLYAQMKKRVAEGRWRVTGSWVDAVDTNIPSPESLIRQTLYGNGFFKREFGKTSVDVFLPDCFGFGYALPTIAAHCGLKGFSTQKLTWGSSVGIPFNIGTWEGVDGSSVVAALDPGGYGGDVGSDWNKADWLAKRIDEGGAKSGLYADYRYHGTGDRGGGPSERSVRNLEATVRAGGPLKVLSAGGDQLFRDITPSQAAKLPHYKGELLLKTHGTGCYTSQTAMKHWNRENEQLADSAERAAAMADILSRGSTPYPTIKLRNAWVRFLWNQFHDDLTGTSIPGAYVFSWNDELVALNQFAEVLKDSATTVASAMDTRARGVPVVVYNPLGTARRDPVQANLTFPGQAPSYVRVVGPNGLEVPSQVIGRQGSTATVVFVATAPGVGMSVYDVQPSSKPSPKTGLRASGRMLENDRYRVALDGVGDIASVYDKSLGKELLKTPVRLAMLADKGESWPAWEVSYRDVTRAPREYVAGPARIEVVENGPARVALRVSRGATGSRFIQTISLAAGSSRVEVQSSVNWLSKGTLLKAVFPCATSNPKATYDLGIGTIQRGNDRPELYEVPGQQWADLTDAAGTYGLAVLSDCKYGWDKPDDRTLRLTLIHTPEAGGYQSTNDLGHHRFGYAIYGHRGDWRQGTAVEAARFNRPLVAFQAAKAAGPLGREFSMVSPSSTQVAIGAFKKAEDGSSYVVRVLETQGRAAKMVSLSFADSIKNVRELNGAEEPLDRPSGAVSASGTKLSFSLRPYRPRTFAVTFQGRLPRVGGPRSTAVPLPYDSNVVSLRQHPGPSIDGQGHSIPAELWPSSLVSEGVRYRLGPTLGKNAVVCRGQTIKVPKSNRLSVLAASILGDVEATFRIGSRTQRALVPYFSGSIGQWDSRIVGGHYVDDPAKFAPAFLKRTPIAWLGTHRHDRDANDEPYVFCYLFKVTFPVPAGATTMTLPNDPRIRVFAVSAGVDPRPALAPAHPLYE